MGQQEATEVATILEESGTLWVAEAADTLYAFTCHWAAPMPPVIKNLLEWCNLPTESPGSYSCENGRLAPEPTHTPDLALLIKKAVREPAVAPVVIRGNHAFVKIYGRDCAVLGGLDQPITVRVDFLRIVAGEDWPQLPMACEGPTKPLCIWTGEQPALVMPIRSS